VQTQRHQASALQEVYRTLSQTKREKHLALKMNASREQLNNILESDKMMLIFTARHLGMIFTKDTVGMKSRQS